MSSNTWSPASGRAWLDNRLATRHPRLFRLVGFIRFLVWLPGALVRGLVHLVRFVLGGIVGLFVGDVVYHVLFGWPR